MCVGGGPPAHITQGPSKYQTTKESSYAPHSLSPLKLVVSPLLHLLTLPHHSFPMGTTIKALAHIFPCLLSPDAPPCFSMWLSEYGMPPLLGICGCNKPSFQWQSSNLLASLYLNNNKIYIVKRRRY